MIYLDTHVIVWLYAGAAEKLSENAKNHINTNDIAISPVVLLELQYLYEIDRITKKSQLIVSDLEDRIGLTVCHRDFKTVVNEAVNHSWTRDPFDRLIVAQAAINSDILLTKDQLILRKYKTAVW